VSEFFLIGEYLAKVQARTWLSRALSSSFSSVSRRAKCMNLFYCVISVQTMHCIHVFTEFRRENVPVYHNALYLCKSSTHYWLKQALNEFCVDVQFCHELISIIHYQWILLVFVFVYYCCICTVTWNYIYYRCVILLTYFSMCILCMLLVVSNIE